MSAIKYVRPSVKSFSSSIRAGANETRSCYSILNLSNQSKLSNRGQHLNLRTISNKTKDIVSDLKCDFRIRCKN